MAYAEDLKEPLDEGTFVDRQDSSRSESSSPRDDQGRSISPPRSAAALEPITLEVLRQKLDAAILAEAWEAVKAIRERMVDVERAQAGNVRTLPVRKAER
jgi:hypothetical protein